jgi:hypothetical protein
VDASHFRSIKPDVYSFLPNWDSACARVLRSNLIIVNNDLSDRLATGGRFGTLEADA